MKATTPATTALNVVNRSSRVHYLFSAISASVPIHRCTLVAMSLTTAFISELVWAANQVEHLTNFEKRRLLERAVATIREMRDQVGIPESKTAADPVIDLQTAAGGIERRTHEHVKAALLDAAEMIRVLRIILEGNE